jgi:hypothetical protein
LVRFVGGLLESPNETEGESQSENEHRESDNEIVASEVFHSERGRGGGVGGAWGAARGE